MEGLKAIYDRFPAASRLDFFLALFNPAAFKRHSKMKSRKVGACVLCGDGFFLNLSLFLRLISLTTAKDPGLQYKSNSSAAQTIAQRRLLPRSTFHFVGTKRLIGNPMVESACPNFN